MISESAVFCTFHTLFCVGSLLLLLLLKNNIHRLSHPVYFSVETLLTAPVLLFVDVRFSQICKLTASLRDSEGKKKDTAGHVLHAPTPHLFNVKTQEEEDEEEVATCFHTQLMFISSRVLHADVL